MWPATAMKITDNSQFHRKTLCELFIVNIVDCGLHCGFWTWIWAAGL